MDGRTDGRTERKIELQRSQIERKRHIEAGQRRERVSKGKKRETKREGKRNRSKRKAIKRGTNGRDKQKGLEIVIQIKGHGANKEKQMERVDDQGRDKGREGMWRDKEKRINREIYA